VNSDSGAPTKNFEGTPQLRDALMTIAQNLAGQVSLRNMRGDGPELTII
jgi:hypothetical protein